MVRQSGVGWGGVGVGQHSLLDGGFTLDGCFRQESCESQGQKLRNVPKNNKMTWQENLAIQPCGSDKVMRMGSKATSDSCDAAATPASGPHHFPILPPDLFFIFHSGSTSSVFFP